MSLKSGLKRVPLLVPAWQRLQRVAWIKRLTDDVRLWRRHGRFSPERLQLPNSGSWMYVDPHENRGRAVLLCGAGGQPLMKGIWHRAVEAIRPTIVLDVGLNYGEFLFAEVYPDADRIIGIEANEHLRPWIERSRAAHPNAGRIETVFALAGDKLDEEGTFFVDPNWSGRSSAVLSATQPGLEQQRTRTVTIDSLLAERDLSQDRLIFKVDVEGYEPPVMRGMRHVASRCGQAFGFAEFNSRFIERLGVDADVYLGELAENFHIFPLDARGRAARINQPTLAELRRVLGCQDVETDLVLASSPEMIELVKIPWQGGND